MTPKQAMELAIEEGKKGAGFVSPNPLVGCVILDREFNFLAKGHHARVGEAHAEINALKNVSDQKTLEGAHVFVTLEPCAHQGRTPSCATHLAGLPIASVTYGLQDPNPLVSGQGAERLRQAGKKVELSCELQAELEELAEIFLTNMRLKRPFVALKVATSLDGQMALKSGESQWITGESAREHVQTLRGEYDAVVVGVGTFLNDNPRLNSRDPRFATKNQRVVILDPSGRSLSKLQGSRLLEVRRPEDVFVLIGSKRACPVTVRQIETPIVDGELDLAAGLSDLMAAGIGSLFVEGGAVTYASFLRKQLADRAYVFFAPKLLGDGRSWTSGLNVSKLDAAVRLRDGKIRTFGEDFLFSGRISI